jgi:hypothetical protein
MSFPGSALVLPLAIRAITAPAAQLLPIWDTPEIAVPAQRSTVVYPKFCEGFERRRQGHCRVSTVRRDAAFDIVDKRHHVQVLLC